MNRPIRVAIPLTLILLVFLVFVACTSGPTNTNQVPVNGTNRGETAVAPPSGTPPRCDPAANSTDRAAALNLHFSDANNANTGDPELDKQRGGGFNVYFEAVGSIVVMRIKGRIASKEQGGLKPKLQQMITRYEWYLKKGCADQMSLESATTSVTSSRGFEWTVCDGTQVTCPNGTCANNASDCPIVPLATPTPGVANPNANNSTTSNSSGNSNSNSNSNSGANRSSNARSGP